MHTIFTKLISFIFLAACATTVIAQATLQTAPLQAVATPEASLAAAHQLNQNSETLDKPLYVRYAFRAVPRGGENPKKVDESVYKTGLEKKTTLIQTFIQTLNGVRDCSFNYAASEVYFTVLRSETQKREVATELSRLLDGLGFEYELQAVSLWK